MSKIFFYLQQLVSKIKSYLSNNDSLGWLDGIAFFICVWFTFFPYPFFELFCTVACIPLLGITLSLFLKIIRFGLSIKKEFHENSVPFYIMLPSILLAIRVFLKFECENYYRLVMSLAIAASVCGIIFILAHILLTGSSPKKKQSYGLLITCILLYSYGVTFGINCLFDKSSPERFESRIVAKYSEGGGEYPTQYYVTVAPWQNHAYKENISVTKEKYELADFGDYICIDVQKGFLHIPWYYIATKK